MNLNKMDNIQPNDSFTFPFILINTLLCQFKFLAWLKCLQYSTNKLIKIKPSFDSVSSIFTKKKNFLKFTRRTYSSELSEIFNHSKKLESMRTACLPTVRVSVAMPPDVSTSKYTGDTDFVSD